MIEPQAATPVVRQTLHFDLAHLGEPDAEYVLQVGLRDVPLRPHDRQTRLRARRPGSFYDYVPDRHLTHYADEVELPADGVVRLAVARRVEIDGQVVEHPVALALHIPESSFVRMPGQALRTAGADPLRLPKLERFLTGRRTLRRHGPRRRAALDQGTTAAAHLLTQAFSLKDARETAIALLFKHPGIANLNGDSGYPAWIHTHLLDHNPHLNELVLTLMSLGDRWSRMEPVLDPETGEPYRDPDDPSRLLYTQKLDARVVRAMAGPLSWALRQAQAATELQGQTWEPLFGRTAADYGATPEFAPAAPAPAAALAPSNGVRWSLKNHTVSWGLTFDAPSTDLPTGGVTLTGYNRWPRHLAAYVEYIDPSGKAVHLTDQEWDQVLDSSLRKILPKSFFEIFEPSKDTRFVTDVDPVTTVCGIPVGALLPDPTRLTFPMMRNDVAGVRVLWAGLGFANENPGDLLSPAAGVGAVLTLVLDVVVPILILIVGSAETTNRIVKALMKDKDLKQAIISLGVMMAGGKILYDLHNGKNLLTAVAPWVGRIVPRLLITSLGPYLLEKLGESALGKLLGRILPGADVAMQVFSVVTTAASIMETTLAVAASPSIYRTEVIRAVDLEVRLSPDAATHRFPDLATRCRVTVVYDSDATVPVAEVEYNLAGPTRSDPFIVSFKDVPAAGRLKAMTFFYAANGWQAGQGSSDWVRAVGDASARLRVEVEVHTNEVPLTAASVYTHKQKLVYRDGRHAWTATATPPAVTHSTPAPDPQRYINVLRGHLTTVQRGAAVGYAWQGRGLGLPLEPGGPVQDAPLYTVQNLSTLQDPERGYWHPQAGYLLPTGIVYDVAGAEDDTARHFYVDPSRGTYDPDRNPAGGFHLRRMAVRHDQPPVSDAKVSWGRFNTDVDRCAVHPQGYVFGISYAHNKLEILRLPPAPYADADAPFAVPVSGEGFREGLMNGPVGLGIALDGRVLVLESVNNRVQSFDLYGNPVLCFGEKGRERSWFSLADTAGTRHYLDLAVEARGYVYVLSYGGDGEVAADYRMDIYTPAGAFLVRTEGVAAARMAVDLIRNVYTLNYETIFAQGGRPEPSLSLWLPPPPSR